MVRIAVLALWGLSVLLLVGPSLEAADPLPSWNEGKTKSGILSFVERVTTPGSADFVAPEARIATFDNDGTLWSEKPMYFQAYFSLDRLKRLAPEHPEWKSEAPFAAILSGDHDAVAMFTTQDWTAVVGATHAGMTTTEFEQVVREWLKTARHPTTGMHFTQMVYQPMLELLAYLRANGFKTYIVSGGGVDFMRAFADQTYGIPPEQIIGSSVKTKFEMRSSGPVLIKLADINSIDDGPGKPENIELHLGVRPVMAFGNSDGDLQMLQWTTMESGPRFGLIVHHTDAQREWAYDRHSSVGHLDKALDQAQERGWTVVDMKQDWKQIYPAH